MNLIEQREATVRRHMEAENRQDVEATLDTFGHARYEVMPFGEATDGAEAVIVETRMTWTQRGEWMGIPPSGRKIDVMAACFFLFEGTQLMCERVYFDSATMLRQLQG